MQRDDVSKNTGVLIGQEPKDNKVDIKHPRHTLYDPEMRIWVLLWDLRDLQVYFLC